MKRFILIHPLAEPWAGALLIQQKEISRRTGAVEALFYPPHLTLRTGALVPQENISSFIAGLEEHLSGYPAFYARTGGIEFMSYCGEGRESFFAGYTVETDFALLDLHQTLWDYPLYAKSERNDFHPHISLAYKDLSREGFQGLKEHWQPEEPTRFDWLLDSVCLYHRPGERWELFHRIGLSTADSP